MYSRIAYRFIRNGKGKKKEAAHLDTLVNGRLAAVDVDLRGERRLIRRRNAGKV